MKNANQPAMPTIYADMRHNGQREIYCDNFGLTKREYFAAMAMKGLCSNLHPKNAADMPSLAVIIADALLKELNK